MKKIVFVTLVGFVCFANMACRGKEPPQPSQTSQAENVGSTITHQGRMLDGSKFDLSELNGNKIIFGFFSYTHKDAAPMLKTLMQLKAYEEDYHFKIFGVSINYDKAKEVKKFLKDNAIDLPVILEDASLALATKLKIENEVTFMALNNQHGMSFGVKKYVVTDKPGGDKQMLNFIKESLSIEEENATSPHLGVYPKAPDFQVTTYDGKKISLSDYKGKAVLILFFSPQCPHCKDEMKFLNEELYPKFKKSGFEILAFSVKPLKGEVAENYLANKYEWPVIDDSDGKIRDLFSDENSVPENFWIDSHGNIKDTSTGYADFKNDTYMMLVKKLLGLPNPSMLSDKRYNGDKTCKICHEAEYASWSLTRHAHAFRTLQIRGEEFNPECVVCHSLGFGETMGYDQVTDKRTGKKVAVVPKDFTDVQCENCHGIGGPHLTKQNEKLAKLALRETCLACHSGEYGKGFDYDQDIVKVNHGNKKEIDTLSTQERENIVKGFLKKE